MKNIFLSLFLLVVTTCSAQTKYTVTASNVDYQIKNVGINTTGTFGSLKQATISFDKGNLAAAGIEAVVDVKKLDSGSGMRDEHLKGEDFFDVAHYPDIIIKSAAIKSKGGNRYTGMFDLTIKNKTKRIEVPFTYTESNNKAAFQSTFKIKRSDYGIGSSTLTLSDEATVNVSITASR